MSTSFSHGRSLLSSRRPPPAGRHQFRSWCHWSALVDAVLERNERSRQRAALRDIADDRHLLDDLGLTRQQVIDEANRPFWE
jgi:uncharacterized protein YjiS (DUF1127 family)